MQKESLSIESPDTLASIKPNFRGLLRKNYLRAACCGNSVIETRVQVVESIYFRILEKVKALLVDIPEIEQRTYYEQNRKGDRSDCTSMWSFMTTSFMLYLTCEFDRNTWIEYSFDNCPVEDQLRQLLKRESLPMFLMERPDLNLEECFEVKVRDNPESIYVLENYDQTFLNH